MTHGHTAPSPSGVREHEGALRGRCVRSVDVHGMDRQAAGVHAVGTRSERATMGSRSRFSAPPMKRRDTFQSERAMCDYSAVLVLGAMCCQFRKRQVEPQGSISCTEVCVVWAYAYAVLEWICACRRCAKLVTRTAACSGSGRTLASEQDDDDDDDDRLWMWRHARRPTRRCDGMRT